MTKSKKTSNPSKVTPDMLAVRCSYCHARKHQRCIQIVGGRAIVWDEAIHHVRREALKKSKWTDIFDSAEGIQR